MAEKYTVNTASLRIRKGDSVDYGVAGYVRLGMEVTVYETSNNFGRIGPDQWVSMSYLKKTTGSTYKSGNVVTASYTPTSDTKNRPIYFLQSDSRWKNLPYTSSNQASQTIGSSGCGPSSAAMIINTWVDNKFGPVEACAFSLDNGYRTANSGTAWGLFKALAVKYGLEFVQTASYDIAKTFMLSHTDAMMVCSMKSGVWSHSGGHYVLTYKIDNKYVYVNDPISTKSERQKSSYSNMKDQCKQYFCFAKPGSTIQKTEWKEKVEIVNTNASFVVSAFRLNVRESYTTKSKSIAIIKEGTFVKADKRCGDWYHITAFDYNNNKAVDGWCSATHLEDADIDNVNSAVAVNCKEAIEHLVKIGFIDSPYHWNEVGFDIDFLPQLIIKVNEALENKNIESNPGNAQFGDTKFAIDTLVRLGVIDSAAYWYNNYEKVKYLNTFLRRAAEWLS